MASSATEQKTDASKRYGQAVRLLQEGNYDKARAALVEFEQKHPDQLQMLARARVFLKACERLKANGRQQEKKPEPKELYVVGLIEHNRGNYPKALEILGEALKKAPSDAAAIHLTMAASLVRQGNSAEAIKHLKSSIDKDPSYRVWIANDPDFESLHRNDEFLKLIRRSGRK